MTDDTTTPAPPRYAAAMRWLKKRIQAWMERAGAAMVRAEVRIMENFRVPPGGG